MNFFGFQTLESKVWTACREIQADSHFRPKTTINLFLINLLIQFIGRDRGIRAAESGNAKKFEDLLLFEDSLRFEV